MQSNTVPALYRHCAVQSNTVPTLCCAVTAMHCTANEQQGSCPTRKSKRRTYRRRMNAQALRAARARIVRHRGEVVARSTRRPVAGVQVRKARASRQHGQERDESGGEEAWWDEDDEEKEGDEDGSVSASDKGRGHAGRRRQRDQTPQDGADR